VGCGAERLIDLLLPHVLVFSEKYCFLHTRQTKHTVHREGKERVQNVELQSWNHRIIQYRRRPFGPSNLHRPQSHPRPYPPHIHPANPSNPHIPGHYGQFSMANQPHPHIFGVIVRRWRCRRWTGVGHSKMSHNTRLKSNRFILNHKLSNL